MAVNAKLLEEGTLFKVVVQLGIKRIGAGWPGQASVTNLVPVLVPVAAPCRGKTLMLKHLGLVPVVGLEPTRLFIAPGF